MRLSEIALGIRNYSCDERRKTGDPGEKHWKEGKRTNNNKNNSEAHK
jgi:hypothetical protein